MCNGLRLEPPGLVQPALYVLRFKRHAFVGGLVTELEEVMIEPPQVPRDLARLHPESREQRADASLLRSVLALP